jgi:hypothetical protein
MGALEDAIFALSLEGGPDEEVGSITEAPMDWAGIMRGGPSVADGLEDGGFAKEFSLPASRLAELRSFVGVILHTDVQGFNEVHYYDSPAKLERAWSDITDALVTEDEFQGRLKQFDPGPMISSVSARIHALRTEALKAGDYAQVKICDLALDGDKLAQAKCERVLNQAVAAEFEGNPKKRKHHGRASVSYVPKVVATEAEARSLSRSTGERVRFTAAHGGFVDPPGLRLTRPNPRAAELDEHAARELELYIENDYPLVGAPNSQGKQIEKNLEQKVKKGTFDFEKSIKLWEYLIEAGAKKYSKEFSIGSDWAASFSPATRRYVAQRFAQSFADERQLRQNSHRRGQR